MRILSLSLTIISLFFSITNLTAQCADCDDLMCFTCDPTALQSGISATMPSCTFPCPVQSGQPNPLCNSGGAVPNNMSWIPFIASDEYLSFLIALTNCTATGAQFGIYESCDFDNCVFFESNCVSNTFYEFDYHQFNIGQTYYFWIDGCSGDVCDYTFEIPELTSVAGLLPAIDAITAEAICNNEILTDDFSTGANNASISGNCFAADFITVCPGQEIQFSVIHQGGSALAIPQIQDPCNEYLDYIDAEFHWSTSWGGSITYNPYLTATGEFIDVVIMPQVEGTYTICLDFIETECSTVTGPVCLEIHVVEEDLETFDYQVCAEDLQFGWNPALGDQDWLGEEVYLDEVLSWPQNGDGFHCMTYNFLDPDCLCEIPQELCILPGGNLEYTDIELYMFRSQFEICDTLTPLICDQEPYVWTWDWNNDDEEIDLDGPELPDTMTQQMMFRIEGYSQSQEDWSGDDDYCDTLVAVTVTVKNPPIIIDDFGCGAFVVSFDQGTYYNQTGAYRQYPPIDHDSIRFSIVDCATGNVLSMSTGISHLFQFSSPTSNYCINMTYDHTDGAWWDWENQVHTHGSGFTPITQTTTTYGPYDYNQGGTVSPPQVSGPTTFCESNLSGHVYSIVNPVPGLTYVWNMNPIVSAAVVTDISANGDGSIVSIDFPPGYNTNDCINVVSLSSCGQSNPESVCISFSPAPTVTLAPVEDICVLSAPDPNALTITTFVAQASPASSNYQYTWNSIGSSATTFTNTVDFNYPSPGIQSVTVSVQDTITGCSSVVSAPIAFEVIPPLDSPVLTCSSQSESELTISWNSVVGATGYVVLIDGIVAMQGASSDLSFTLTGLSPGTQATFSVIAVGPAPCFNSAPSSETICVTTQQVDNDGDGSPAGIDCDDNDPNNYPGNTEVCDDGQDNNCNGLIDEESDIITIFCSDVGLDFVSFDWNDIANTIGYNLTITINGDPSTTAIVGNHPRSNYIVVNLNENDNVEIEVEAVTSIGCVAKAVDDCSAAACPRYPDLDFNDCEEFSDRLVFSWNPIINIDSFEIIVLPSGTPFRISDRNYTLNNLAPRTTVSISVRPIHPILGCTMESREQSCTTICPNFPAINLMCNNFGSDFIDFSWDDVADSYTVCADGVELGSSVDAFYNLSGLTAGQSVEFSVASIYADGCISDKETITCVTTTVIDNDGDGSPAGIDCDDNDPNNSPGSTEICDGQDNNCDGVIDEGFDNTALVAVCTASTDSTITIDWNALADAQVYYVYIDGSYNSASDTSSFTLTGLMPDQIVELRIDAVFTNGCPIKTSLISCTASSIVIDNDGDGIPAEIDCDDNDANNYPGNVEICDEADNNCDGQIDEGLPVTTYYSDMDMDGYGVDSTGFDACLQPLGTTTVAGDCDDTNPDINPAATEIPGNDIDEDCDGEDGGVATHDIGGYSLNIFPNPVRDFMIIDTELENLSYKLMSIDGRLVQSGNLAKRQVDVTTLESGSYLIIIKSSVHNEQIVERIVKR